MNVKELSRWLNSQPQDAVIEILAISNDTLSEKWNEIDFEKIRTALYQTNNGGK